MGTQKETVNWKVTWNNKHSCWDIDQTYEAVTPVDDEGYPLVDNPVFDNLYDAQDYKDGMKML